MASDAKMDAIAESEAIIRVLYRGFLGRDPDLEGLRSWAAVYRSEGGPGIVLNGIARSAERQEVATGERAALLFKNRLAERAGPRLRSRPYTIVDIGAQDLEDEQHVYAPLCVDGIEHRIIGFEPLEDKLVARRDGNPDSQIELLPTFIGDGGRHVFHINNTDATSSLLPLNHELNDELRDLSHLKTVRTEVVTTSALDEVLADRAPHVDFLKLDIQGFELPALQHATSVLARTNVVHCEVSFMPIYRNQALFSEVERYLRDRGFHFLDFSSTCRYPYHSRVDSPSRDRLGWGDAVFFKNIDLLSSPDDLLSQCLTAAWIYDKISLAERLAERFEEMTGESLR